jgi:hypothetical protein
VPLVDRSVYPEAQYPVGQWDYQLFYEESFDKASAAFEANVRNTVKALFRKGSPSGKGKPSRTAVVRRDGGWFGGTGQAPDVPMDAGGGDRGGARHVRGQSRAQRFFGPDSWYMNAERNLEYAAGQGRRRSACRPVPARRVRLHVRDRRLPAGRAHATRLPEPHRDGRAIGPLDGAGETARRERGPGEVAGDPASPSLARPMTEKRPATASRGMVVTNHPLGSAAGAEMLAAGGNAVDAAIAALFALTVVEPMMVGIFGAGMTISGWPTAGTS